MLELVLGGERLGVPAEEPRQQVFARPPDPHRDLADRCLERLVVAEPATAERLLDHVVEVVVLILRDPPRAVAPDAGEPEHLALVDPHAEQDRKRAQRLDVFGSHRLVGARRRQAERDEDALESLDVESEPVGELGERLVRAWMASSGALEVSERQVAASECRGEVVSVDALRLECRDDPHAHHVASLEPVLARVEDAERHQSANLLERNLRPVGDFFFRETVLHRRSADERGGIGDERVVAGL